jgi:hypothetical protein
MSLWRVRITMSDDPASEALLNAALARQRIAAHPPPLPESSAPGDVIVDLPRDDRLGALLNELHQISPQVFVSSVDAPLPLALAPQP